MGGHDQRTASCGNRQSHCGGWMPAFGTDKSQGLVASGSQTQVLLLDAAP